MTDDHTFEWDGVVRPSDYKDWIFAARDALADAARDGDWPAVLARLGERPAWVNRPRIGGASGFTPLHQAAWLGVDADLAARLVAFGAWRTLRTTDGRRALDIAVERGQAHLVAPLTPEIHHRVPAGTLSAIQAHFHDVVRGRGREFGLDETISSMRLPQLEPLTEQRDPACWFPIPGMYGGFSYALTGMALTVQSWSRVSGGSGQRHVIDADGARLVEEGFV